MKRFGSCFALIGVTFLSHVSFAQRNPIGESAHYEMDRDRERTSRSIRDGDATASISEMVNTTTFKVNLDYNIKTTVFGNHSGNAPTDFPAQFFSEQFLIDLRHNGHYEDEKLKVDYEGSGRVETMNGAVYENCDFIRVYDIQDAGGDVEDLEIRAAIKYGLPVLGATKIDLSGKVRGISLKAGFDYAP